MENAMGIDLSGLLKQYLGDEPIRTTEKAAEDFHQVAENAPPEVVGEGLSEVFRSDQTPPFGQMVGQLFGNADPQQRSGMLNQLVNSISPALLHSIGVGQQGDQGQAPAVTPDLASRLTPEQVQQLAEHAEQENPGVIDNMSRFYADHPGLVKTIGGAALAIAMAKIAEKMKS
jgi:hypothetical protein